MLSESYLDWLTDVFIGVALDLGMTGFAQDLLDGWALA
jgi:hypothetical protein